MSAPQPWRAAAFAEKRPAASISACGGSVFLVASSNSGRFSNAENPLRNSLWHPLNIPLPRAPSKRELQHGLARSAARPSSKPASTSASTARRSQALVVKRAAKPTGRPPFWSPRLEGAGGSGTFKGCQSLVEGISGLRLTPSACRDFTMQNDLFFESIPWPCRAPAFAEKRPARPVGGAAAGGICTFPLAGGRLGWGSNAGTAPTKFRPPPQPSPCPGAGARTSVARTLGVR